MSHDAACRAGSEACSHNAILYAAPYGAQQRFQRVMNVASSTRAAMSSAVPMNATEHHARHFQTRASFQYRVGDLSDLRHFLGMLVPDSRSG